MVHFFNSYVKLPEGITIILRKIHQNTDHRMMMRSVGARNAGFTHFGCREHDDPSTFGFFPF